MVAFKILMSIVLVISTIINCPCSAEYAIEECEKLIKSAFAMNFGIPAESRQTERQCFDIFYQQFNMKKITDKLGPEEDLGHESKFDANIRHVKRKLISGYMNEIYDVENLNIYLTIKKTLFPSLWCADKASLVIRKNEHIDNIYHVNLFGASEESLKLLGQYYIDTESSNPKSAFKIFYDYWTDEILKKDIKYVENDPPEVKIYKFYTYKFVYQYYNHFYGKLNFKTTGAHNTEFSNVPYAIVKFLNINEYCTKQGQYFINF